MLIDKRIIALFVMTIVTTVTPAVYQIGIQPRVEGAQCDITITSLQMDQDQTGNGLAVFKAYLRVENHADVNVILSELHLDVYHHSAKTGRYELIGTLNTSQEYQIQANNFIQSVYSNGVVTTINPADNDRSPVVAVLTFYQDSADGSATTEAIGDLISQGYLSVELKGNAQVGPFSFSYQRFQTISLNFWDPNFVVQDIFPLYQNNSVSYEPNYQTAIADNNYANSDIGEYVIEAKMHNPSGIPMVLENYNFSLVDSTGKIRAWGIPLNTTLNAYDPDVTSTASTSWREKLINVFKDGNQMTTFSADPNQWQTVFFGLDFNDPTYNSPNNITSATEMSQTRNNLAWFFNQLLTQPTISGLSFRGTCSLILGWMEGQNYKGISVNVGSNNPNQQQFNIYNVQFHQQNYQSYNAKDPVALEQLIVPENVSVDSVTVNATSDDVSFLMSSILNFTNPYRFAWNFTDLSVNYYRIDKNNEFDYAQTYLFANNTEGNQLVTHGINSAQFNDSANSLQPIPTVTQVPINFSLSFNTTNYVNTTGISKVLSDLQINPEVVNWTNPFGLMSPSVMNVDPLTVMKYLISNGLDPLMLLNETQVTQEIHDGGDAYYPLQCMYFGSRDRNSGYNVESGDLNTIGNIVSLNPNYEYDNRIVRPLSVSATWGNEFTMDPTSPQWEVASRDPTVTPWIWENTTNTNLQRFNGLIMSSFDSQGGMGINYTTNGSYYNNSALAWRIYSPSYGTDKYDYDFGYWYDYESELRNYYMCYDPQAGINGGASQSIGMAFVQNFTINNPQDPTQSLSSSFNPNDITKATMSISYRYPGYPYEESVSDGLLGIGNYTFNNQTNTYSYDFSATPGLGSNPQQMYTSGSGLWGVNLNNNAHTADWQTKVIDITSLVRNAITEYEKDNNSNDLKFEYAFGVPDSSTNDFIQFDDAVVQINYKTDGPAPFQISNLFNYTQNADSVNGNMWNILSNMGFNSTDFAAFLGNDLGKGISSSLQQPDLSSFLAGTDTSLSNLTNLMEYNYTSFNSSQPTNFFEMMNQSQYYIPVGGGSENVPGLGWRDQLGNTWVIKDPYQASKAISDALARNMFVDPTSGKVSLSGEYGEELWAMFNNLGVYLPWVMMYLMSKGWTKDDIFDALEALGFASEVKDQYSGADATGLLQTTIRVQAHINLFGNIIDESVPFQFNMGQTIDDGYQELFRYLLAPGESHVYGGTTIPNSRPIISSNGTFSNAVPWIGTAQAGLNVLLTTIHFNIYLTLTPQNFQLEMWMQNLQQSGVPPTSVSSDNPYLILSTQGSGLNDAGAKILGSLLRENLKFNNAPFIYSGGDPIGLFQFLDNYYFTQVQPNNLPVGQTYDYSSYTLLNYFNVKSTDFVDLMTGYNWPTNTFDPSHSGTVEDWRAPLDYGNGYNLDNEPNVGANTSSSWPGWGTNFWDQRIFWDPNNPNDPYNGGVMWSDSPDLLYLNKAQNSARTDAHLEGNVYLGGGGNKADDPSAGAPPVVNLIDMLAWLSETTGNPSPDNFFKWIIGELPSQYYEIVNPNQPAPPTLYNINSYQHGIGLQKTWAMLQNCTFNTTGMFNWLENTQKADPYKLMYQLENFTGGNGSPTPEDLMFFALNPNLIMTPAGNIEFIYHDALGATQGLSEEYLWQLFNASYWQSKGYNLWNYQNDPTGTLPYLLFQDFRQLELGTSGNSSTGNEAFNLWNMFISLDLNSADWWNVIQYDPSVTITPLNVLFSSDLLNITKLMDNAKNAGLSSRMLINGSFNLWLSNMPMTYSNYWNNTLSYSMTPSLFTAAYNWANFINPNTLYRATFKIVY